MHKRRQEIATTFKTPDKKENVSNEWNVQFECIYYMYINLFFIFCEKCGNI